MPTGQVLNYVESPGPSYDRVILSINNQLPSFLLYDEPFHFRGKLNKQNFGF